jgi:thioesterase domain-containing protein
LFDHLRRRLPEVMVPAVLIELGELPRTASGKLDRRALPPVDGGHRPGTAYEEPRTDTERAVAEVMTRVLGPRRLEDVGPIGRAHGFFDLGGHSLLAFQLVSGLRRLGADVPLLDVFRHPTVAGLARVVEVARRPSWGAADSFGEPGSPLLELGTGVAVRPPLFLVHPVGGDVHCYAALAAELDLPVYGLAATGDRLQGAEGPEGSALEAMARRYLKAVRDRLPAGPYQLGGWSMGGIVAFEMARQLEAAGEEVASLIVIDSPAPGLHGQLPEARPALERAFVADLARSFGVDPGVALDRLARPPGGDGDAVALAGALSLLGASGELEPEVARALFARYADNLAALRQYRGGRYGGELLLLRCGRRTAGSITWGWDRLARSVHVSTLAGDHYSCLRPPHVAGAADRLESFLL